MSIDVVLEGEHTFPSINLFSTAGTSESALSTSDVTAATWTRRVKGTGEIVNSRSGVTISMPLSAMPFDLEQSNLDNTRVNSDRRREVHELVIEYTYTRSGVTGKKGVFRADFLVIPTDRVVYKVLDENSRFLRRVMAGFQESDGLLPDDLYDAEEDVGELIESRLGKRFWTSSLTAPRIIEHVADLLGSAMIIEFTHVAMSEETSKYAARLRKEGEGLLDEIVAGKRGVQYPDGTWDSDYPAPTRTLRKAKKGRVRNLVFDRSIPFHEQHGHSPTETDDELFGHDDRTARGSEYDGE